MEGYNKCARLDHQAQDFMMTPLAGCVGKETKNLSSSLAAVILPTPGDVIHMSGGRIHLRWCCRGNTGEEWLFAGSAIHSLPCL